MQGKPKQLWIFDMPRPAQPPPVPQKNHDHALLNFFEDIDGKKTSAEIGQWRMKHQPRINRLTLKQREIIDSYYQKRKEELK